MYFAESSPNCTNICSPQKQFNDFPDSPGNKLPYLLPVSLLQLVAAHPEPLQYPVDKPRPEAVAYIIKIWTFNYLISN